MLKKMILFLRFPILLAVLCAGAYYVAAQVTTRLASTTAAPRAFVPYTLEQHTVARTKTGALEVTEQRIIAVRSDGSEVWLGTFPGRKAMGPIRKIVRSNGWTTIALEKISARISQMLPAREQQARHEKVLDAAKECRFAYEKPVGTGTLLGIRVSVSEYSQSPDRRDTNWRALDYECAVIATRHERLRDGKWTVDVESVPVLFAGGEPKAELFDEGFYDQLQEMPPSEAQRRVYAALNITEAQCPRCFNPTTVEKLDSDYFSNQASR